MIDEEVIRRRLLIDGDGTGDDRRLNVLLKNVIKWCNTSSDDSSAESQALYDRMLAQLAQCEFAVRKSNAVAHMMSNELQSYADISTNIQKSVEDVKRSIERSKETLREAKIVRKNKMAYDMLAKVIQEQPDRKETNSRLAKLKAELGELEGRRNELERKISMRRKQFYVLVSCANQLKNMIEQPEADDCEIIEISKEEQQMEV